MPLMGGLRKKMPLTFWTFLIGALSLAGVFPLAGFWSKDEILLDAYLHDPVLWIVGTIVAFLTALYMFRAIFMTFFGEYRGGAEPEVTEPPGEAGAEHQEARQVEEVTDPAAVAHHHHAEPHESPASMTAPLVILAVPAVFAGFFALMGFGEFVEGALPVDMRHFALHPEAIVIVTSVIAALAGIGVAAALYYARQPDPDQIRARIGPVHNLVNRLYYVNEIAEDGMTRGVLYRGLGGAAAAIDTYVVDGAVNGAGWLTRTLGDGFRRSAAGQLQAYTSVFIVGVVVLVGAFFLVSGGLLDRLAP
jgi:NADH-quinone oxidoreductase subunit L